MRLSKLNKQIEFSDYYNESFNWNDINVYKNKKFSITFYNTFVDKINWQYVSLYCQLTYKLCDTYKDKLDWRSISAMQQLTPKFMLRYKDYLNWYDISVFQCLSKSFIRNNKSLIDFNRIFWKFSK
jgi:hypothetical protein